MALQTLRTLAQLKEECNQLNLQVVQSGKRESKTDFIKVLREYHLNRLYGSQVPKSLELILQIESPMLCEQYKVCKPEQQKEMWSSKSWIAQEKIDGNRQLIIMVDGKPNCYSRNNSVEDYLPVNYTDNIYFGDVDSSKITCDFILDTEIISTEPKVSTFLSKTKGCVTETQLQATSALLALNPTESVEIQKQYNRPLMFIAFDILYYDGEWLIDKPLFERLKYFNKALQQFKEAGYNVSTPLTTRDKKEALFKQVLGRGGEGIVLKNLYSKYNASSNRRKDGWVKVKRSMADSLKEQGLADTVDGWISGFELADEKKSWAGLVGSLQISCYIKEQDGSLTEHVIANIANITLDLRKQLTSYDEAGNPILDPSYYGRVVEVDGQDISARSKALTHAVLKGFRPDRSPDTCIITREFLESQIL